VLVFLCMNSDVDVFAVVIAALCVVRYDCVCMCVCGRC